MAGEHLIHAHLPITVPLVDACDTEWRKKAEKVGKRADAVPLVDACDTEWRIAAAAIRGDALQCHSLMPVILNGGGAGFFQKAIDGGATR